MDTSRPCCRHPDTLPNATSPFTRIVALGYYDGPTDGLMQCATCSAICKFDMLDWDDDHRVRIFRLSELPANALAEFLQIAEPNESPRWPIWAPSWQWPSEQARTDADRKVQQILDQAEAGELVVAFDLRDNQVLAARRFAGQDLAVAPDWFSAVDPVAARDWFQVLGLRRNERGQPIGVK